MIARAVQAEIMKLRRTWVLPLAVLGPAGVVGVTSLRIALRPVVMPGSNNWPTLVGEIQAPLVPALILGIAILGALVAGMEHRGRMWKAQRSLPVSATGLYAAKFLSLAGLLAVSACLCAIGTAVAGISFGYGPVPWGPVWVEGIRPYIASYGLIGLQLAMSVLFANQAYAIGVGIVSFLVGTGGAMLPAWLPTAYPGHAAASAGFQGWTYALAGLAVGAVLLAAGAYLFRRQESP